MGRMARDITNTELAILKELWLQHTATVQELTEALYRDTTPALLETVRKLLYRMKKEGYVICDRTKWPHSYRAGIEKGKLVDNRLLNLTDTFFDGDRASLMIHLIHSLKLTSQDCETLRKLLGAKLR
jgi:BlaI family transcriptional regulator, penicillinase repressor